MDFSIKIFWLFSLIYIFVSKGDNSASGG